MLLNYRDYGRLWRVYGRSVVRYATPRKVINALRTECAYRTRRLQMRSRPYILFVEPLYYCNLTCPLCPRQHPELQGQPAKLELPLIDRVIDEIGPYLFQCHIFGNGEPLLDWPRTQHIIDKAHQHRVFTMVSTNGTFVTEAMANEIIDSALDYLVVAIDGVSQQAYERYRVGGRVEDALNGLRYLAEQRRRHRRGPMIEWQYLVHRHNEHEMDQASRLAEELGVYLRFAPIGGMGADPQVQQQWLARDPKWHGRLERPGEPMSDMHCYWLWRSAYVNANGTLGRCPKYSASHPLGDLREHSLLDLYNGRVSQGHRTIFNRASLAEAVARAPCSTCTFYTRCHPPPATTVPITVSTGLIN